MGVIRSLVLYFTPERPTFVEKLMSVTRDSLILPKRVSEFINLILIVQC